MMENMQEKLERAYGRINELQNNNLELRERNSSLLKEQIQAQAIIEKQKNVVKEWIVVQDNISMTAIKRNSILAVYQNRNMDEAFVCTTNGKEFLIRLPAKTVLKSIIGGNDAMDKQDLDYPECPYCGTRVRMTPEIENMQNLDEIEVACHHCGMLYSIEAFFTYDCHKIEGLK